MKRIILHCDCNSFFASVETLDQPELAKVPMAVTGNPDNRHGIILAKNALAKKYGIQTAETIYSARQKCPQLVCVRSHMEKYQQISRQINRIYLDYTDLVEPFSVDESFLDVTGSIDLFGLTPKGLADQIRSRVHAEVGVTISIGVSFCKVFAKLGSDYQKPDATTVFDEAAVEQVVYALPVSDLLFVGRKTETRLRDMGIQTIGDLSRADYEKVVRYLGEAGNTLWRYARGLDTEPVHSFYEKREVKSIGNGMTFRRDLCGQEEIRAGILALCDELVCRLREEHKKCYVVQVTIKDPDFKVMQRQKTRSQPTWLLNELADTAMELICANWKMNAPIRMLTVTASNLVNSDTASEQLSLFEEKSSKVKQEKREKMETALADIRHKMGRDSIYLGLYDRKDIGISNVKEKKKPEKGHS